MIAGDEIAAVVADLGSHCSKFGHAGNGSPSAVVSSIVGGIEQLEEAGGRSKRYYVGDTASTIRRDGMEVASIMRKDGRVNDWNALENLWHHAWNNCLFVPAEERPVMISDIHFDDHLKMLELMFEKFHCPAAYLPRGPTLSAFASGRRTALVVEVGGSAATATAVVDGFVLNRGMQRSDRAGDWLDQQLLGILHQQNIEVHPRFLVNARQNQEGNKKSAVMNPTQTHESYTTLKKMEIIRDLKEAVCAVPSEPAERQEILSQMPEQQYELPDGTIIQVDVNMFLIPELLFDSSAAVVLSSSNSTQIDLPQVVHKALAACDGDARKELSANIILCGGSSLFEGMPERLGYELTHILPSAFKVRVVNVNPNPLEKKFSAWIGGSILCSLGSFQQLWLSKQEYEEHGSKILEDRFEY